MSRRREVETTDFVRGFLRRIIKSAGKRVAEGEPLDLAELVAAQRELDQVIVDAVHGMREMYGWSWAEIGRELGVTRQAAQMRYGRKITDQSTLTGSPVGAGHADKIRV